jgi:hypothetical protein
MDMPVGNELGRRQQVALGGLRAVNPEGVELVQFISSIDHPLTPAPRGVEPNQDDVPMSTRELALDA